MNDRIFMLLMAALLAFAFALHAWIGWMLVTGRVQ